LPATIYNLQEILSLSRSKLALLHWHSSLLTCDSIHAVLEYSCLCFKRWYHTLVGHLRYHSNLHLSTWVAFRWGRNQKNSGMHKWNVVT